MLDWRHYTDLLTAANRYANFVNQIVIGSASLLQLEDVFYDVVISTGTSLCQRVKTIRFTTALLNKYFYSSRQVRRNKNTDNKIYLTACDAIDIFDILPGKRALTDLNLLVNPRFNIVLTTRFLLIVHCQWSIPSCSFERHFLEGKRSRQLTSR